MKCQTAQTRPRMSLILWDTDGNFGDAIFKHIYMKEASAALIIGDIGRATNTRHHDQTWRWLY